MRDAPLAHRARLFKRLGARREAPTEVEFAVAQHERLDAMLPVVAQLARQSLRALRHHTNGVPLRGGGASRRPGRRT
jgi:hypothetical protein